MPAVAGLVTLAAVADELLDRADLDVGLAYALLREGRLSGTVVQGLLAGGGDGRPGGSSLGRTLVERGVLGRAEVEAILRAMTTDATEPERSPQAAATGRVVGDYELVRELGSGGMGTVYLARHRSTGARCALKTLTVGDAEALERFQREGEGQARVDDHPGVVRVHTLGRAGGVCYLVMDLATGGSLEDRLKTGLPAPEEAAVWARDLAWATEHAHRRGVLHRDLKPQNVLFADDETPQLVDFGLAKLLDARSLTVSGTTMGTPGYMAPEQVDGGRGQIGPPADVYGLAAVLYRCLTGRPPVRGGSLMNALLELLEKPPPPPSSLRPEVPPALEAVCLRGLEKDPAARYPTAAAFAEALEGAMGAAPGAWRRRAGPLAVLAGGAAVAVLGGLAAWWPSGDPAPPPSPSETADRGETGSDPSPSPSAAEPADRSSLSEEEVLEGRYALRQLRRVEDSAERESEATDWLEAYPGHPDAPSVRALRARARLRHPEGVLEHGGPDVLLCGGSFLPDGGRCLTWAYGGKAVLWNVAERRRLHERSFTEGKLTTLALGPGGGVAYLAVDDTLARLDLDTRELERLPSWEGGWIYALAVSPQGRTVAVAGDDATPNGGRAALFDVDERRFRPLTRTKRARFRAVAFSPDGERVVGGHGLGAEEGQADNGVRVWSVETAELAKRWEIAGQPRAIAFAPDGDSFFVGTTNQTLLRIAVEGAEVRSYLEGEGVKGEYPGHPAAMEATVRGLAVTADGGRIYAVAGDRGADGELRGWELSKGDEVRRVVLPFMAHSLDLSPDGEQLLVGLGAFRAGPPRFQLWATGAEGIRRRTAPSPSPDDGR